MRFSLILAVAGLVGLAFPAFFHTVSGTAFADSVTLGPQNKTCWREYQKYKKEGRLHKAFAISTVNSYDHLQACGKGWGFSSKKDATGRALTECRAEAKRYKVRGPCRVFAAE